MSPVALVTGTSRGVGRATALRLAEDGFRLALVGRASAAEQETERLLVHLGAQFSHVPCDLARPAEVAEAARAVLERFGPPDVVVHNAGIIERAAIAELDDASWNRQLEINLSAPFRLTRALLPAMLAANHGRILFVSSISAHLGAPRQAAYHATKAGLVALMRCLAEELKDTNLSTMALLPGAIDTDMLEGSTFPARMTAAEVAETLAFYAQAPGRGHHGSVVDMLGV
jgi:3-oxoacyl-[acyl-carrier protein] reductase